MRKIKEGRRFREGGGSKNKNVVERKSPLHSSWLFSPWRQAGRLTSLSRVLSVIQLPNSSAVDQKFPPDKNQGQ